MLASYQWLALSNFACGVQLVGLPVLVTMALLGAKLDGADFSLVTVFIPIFIVDGSDTVACFVCLPVSFFLCCF